MMANMLTFYTCNLFHCIQFNVYYFLGAYVEFTYYCASRLPSFCLPFTYLLSGFMPFYLTYLYLMFRAQLKVLSYLNIAQLNILFYIAYAVQALLLISLLVLRPAYVQRDERVEAFLQRHRKEIKGSKCEICNLTKIMRSYHCEYCKRCITKWQEHSYWFNRCIDARNVLVYWLYLVVSFIICVGSFATCVYYNKTRERQMPKIPFYILLLAIQIISLFKEVYLYTILVCKNLTILERDNWFRVPYMWLDETRQFFNPFDRGLLNNIWQSIKGVFTWQKVVTGYEEVPPVELEAGILIRKIQFIIVKVGIEENVEEEKQDELVDDKESTEDVIKPYDGTWNPNWVTYKIYNIFDLLHAPMRQVVVTHAQAKQAKKAKKLQEASNQ